jgi:hypothetical protein
MNNGTTNLNPNLLKHITENLGLEFIAENKTGNVCFINNNAEMRDDFKQTFTPIDILDYTYAVQYSPENREAYKAFLIIDSSDVLYPKDATTFWQLVQLGSTLRQKDSKDL